MKKIKNFKSIAKSKSPKDLQPTEEHRKPNRLQTEFVSTLSFLTQKKIDSIAKSTRNQFPINSQLSSGFHRDGIGRCSNLFRGKAEPNTSKIIVKAGVGREKVPRKLGNQWKYDTISAAIWNRSSAAGWLTDWLTNWQAAALGLSQFTIPGYISLAV